MVIEYFTCINMIKLSASWHPNKQLGLFLKKELKQLLKPLTVSACIIKSVYFYVWENFLPSR